MCTHSTSPLLQAERYVCSVPRGKYSLLGHRAALALAHEPEGGDSFAAFLRSTIKEEEVSFGGMQLGLALQQTGCTSRPPGCSVACQAC